MTDTNRLFPIFLKLETIPLLLVGGGKVGLEKLQAVLQNAPATQIKLVALAVCDEIWELAKSYPGIHIHKRAFTEDDLDEVGIVIIAVNDPVASREIRSLAKSKSKLVNVADQPELCDFYLGSIVQKGNLKLAISTNGKSPTIAKRLKEVFNELLPEELEEVLSNIKVIRDRLNGEFSEKVARLNEITKELVLKNPDKP